MSRRGSSSDSNRKYEQKYPHIALWYDEDLALFVSWLKKDSDNGLGYDPEERAIYMIVDGEAHLFAELQEGKFNPWLAWAGNFWEVRQVESDNERAPDYKIVIKFTEQEQNSSSNSNSDKRKSGNRNEGAKRRSKRSSNNSDDSKPPTKRRRAADDDYYSGDEYE